MADPIGDAFITIHPDLSRFEAELRAKLAALSALTTGVAVPVSPALAQGAAGAAAAAQGLAGAQTAATGATAGFTAAQVAAAAAIGQATVASAQGASAATALGAAQGAAAVEALGLAGSQAAVNAALRSGGVALSGAAADVAAGAAGAGGVVQQLNKGLNGTTVAGNTARGALIGLSRITPVVIFGLGAAGTAAAAMGLALGKAVAETARFEEQLNVFRVVSEATADQMQRISQLAVDLGADLSLPATSANDAAEAMTELAKAGISVNNVLAATKGVLQLAAAAGVGAGEAARITAFALNAFSLEGEEAAKIADLLAAASISAQGEITDMAQALTQASAVAAQAGISVQDTTTAISLLAKSGLLGSDAGTSLRTTILRLVPTTKEAADTVRALGVEFQDAQGDLLPLSEIFQQYQNTLEGLTETTQQAALTQIFGQDAIRAASIFAREGAEGFEAMAEQVEKEGVAARVADARTQGLSGAAAGLGSNLSTLGITLGGVVAGPLTDFLNSLSQVVSAVNAAAEGVGGLVSAFTNFVTPDVVDPEDIRGVEALREEIEKVNEAIGNADEEGRFVPPVLLKRLRELTKELNEALGAGVAAASGIEDFRVALGAAAAEAERQKQLDPFPDRETTAANVRASLQAVNDAIKSQGQTLRSSLQTLLRLGPESEGALSDQLRADVLRAVEELRKLGPAGEAAIKDLPARLRRVMRIAIQGLVEEANIEIPLRLTIASDLASLSDDLQDDLTAALRTEANLESRLADVEPGTKLYAAILEKLVAAHQKVKGIQAQIKAENDRAASEREKAANDARKVIDDADERVLERLSAGRTALERRVTVAEGTPQETDDVKALKALERRIQAEIDSVIASVKNVKTRTAALRRLGDDLFEVQQDLREARDQVIEAAREDQRERADALTELLAKRITLADLRGNDAAELAAINKAIQNAQFRIKNYKRLGLTLIDEKINLEQLIDLREDLKKEAEKGVQGGGTTAFDLLRQFAETFNQNAGNLINADQPFVGPTGFVADISQFFETRNRVPRQTPGFDFNTGGRPDSTDRAIQRLIEALDRNTTAKEDDDPTGPRTRGKQVNVILRNDRRFWDADEARQVREG